MRGLVLAHTLARCSAPHLGFLIPLASIKASNEPIGGGFAIARDGLPNPGSISPLPPQKFNLAKCAREMCICDLVVLCFTLCSKPISAYVRGVCQKHASATEKSIS